MIPELNTQYEMLIAANNTLTAKSDESTIATSIDSLQKAVTTYKNVGMNVKKLNTRFEYNSSIRVLNDRLGKISYTYESALAHIKHTGTWLAVAIALIIDLIVPLFVIFLTPRGSNPNIARYSSKTSARSLNKDF